MTFQYFQNTTDFLKSSWSVSLYDTDTWIIIIQNLGSTLLLIHADDLHFGLDMQ